MNKIMTKIFLTLIGLTIVSCETETPNVNKKSTDIIYSNDGTKIEEIVHDGCQYIGHFTGSYSDWGAHKGTCNNPIHKQNKVTVVDTVEYKLIREN